MIYIENVNYPIRITKKDEYFYLYNTKTFEAILLDEISMKIFKKIRNSEKCNFEELKYIVDVENVNIEDLDILIKFLYDNKFIEIDKGTYNVKKISKFI